MALDIGRALVEGAERTATRNGLVLIAAFSVIGIAGGGASAGIQQFALRNVDAGGPAAVGPGPLPPYDPAVGAGFGFGLPLSVLFLLIVVTAVLAEAVNIVTLRTFTSEYTEEIPGEFWSRRIAMATLNGIVGNIVASILIAIGLLLLIVPGIFLAISFLFLRAIIAVEDENFVDAMGSSWALAKGNRLALFGLLVVVFVVALAIGLVGGLLDFGLGAVSPLLAAVANAVVGAVGTVFTIAVVARAYRQLRDEHDAESSEVGGEVTI